MCGFAFYIGKKEIKDSVLNQTKESLYRRGPDEQRIKKLKNNTMNCYMIHSRLAIIDSLNDKASQPFHSNGYYIVYNGEIYNYKTIRKELEYQGHKFSTKSDTEVLIKYISQYNGENLSRLEGMWSFVAIKDDLSHWIASRDIFSEKPLFYHKDNEGGIYYASTPLQIKILLNSDSKDYINEDYIKRYLYLGHRGMYATNDCLLQKTRRVEGNSVIKEDGQNFNLSKIIDIPRHETKESKSHEEYKDMISNVLNDSYNKDKSVKASCMLSGGIDSNLIYHKWNENKEEVIDSYTLKIKDKKYDESEIVKSSVKKIKEAIHKFVEIDKDLSYKWLRSIISENLDFLPSITSIAFAHVANKAKDDDHKVILTGVGGDEMFAGYLVHHLYFLAELERTKSNKYNEEYEIWDKEVNSYIRNKELKDPKSFAIKYNQGFWIDNNEEMNLFRNIKEVNKYNIEALNKNNSNDKNFLWKSLMNDLFISSIPAQTSSADYVSMFFSLENRAPLLSYKILDIISTMPLEYFIKDGKSKYMIRELFKDLIPEEILNSSEKIGFNVSIIELFGKKMILSILESPRLPHIITKSINLKSLKDNIINDNLSNGISKLIFRILSIASIYESLEYES